MIANLRLDSNCTILNTTHSNSIGSQFRTGWQKNRQRSHCIGKSHLVLCLLSNLSVLAANLFRRLEKSRAQNILWLLEELKIDYDIETFRRGSDHLAPPELKKVHPLGKSPLVSITPPGAEPIVLAESGFITQYLSEHYGKETTMVPKRWKDGQEGKVGGETEEWLRCQYLLHFVEGTFLSTLLRGVVVSMLKSKNVPFLIRPVTSMVANQILTSFIQPNIQRQLAFLEQQLETSGGDFLCGKDLSSADVLLSFGLISAKDRVSASAAPPT